MGFQDEPKTVRWRIHLRSPLLALKAYVDFGIDLRNRDPARTWDDGFVDV